MSIECPFLFEIERKTETPEVERKIQKYAGYWLRRLRKFNEVLIQPVLIVHHDLRPAKRRRESAGAQAMRQKLNGRLYIGGHFTDLQRELKRRDQYANIGRMFLLCEWREVYASADPFGALYYPIGKYDEKDPAAKDEGMTVSLKAAAIERERVLVALGKQAA